MSKAYPTEGERVAARRRTALKFRRAHPERVAAVKRGWHERNRAAVVARQNAREKLFPPAIRRARYAVNNAVRRGKLEKPNACQWCGAKGRIHAHHEDYGKPLEVIWLCPRCHGLTRRKYA